MQLPLICSILVSLGVWLAPEISVPLIVRSVRVKLIQTSERPSLVGSDAIFNALKSRRIAVEERFDPAQLDQAAAVIGEIYAEKGALFESSTR